jgi:signal transduction histidine kinase
MGFLPSKRLQGGRPLSGVALLLCLVLLCAGVRAQGLYPLLRHYGVQGTGLDPQKLAALATDAEGYLLVGTEDGVQRFDGMRWQSLWQEQDYNVTALLPVKGSARGAVYVGGRGHFGMLVLDDEGQYAYTDIAEKLDPQQRIFGEVQRMALAGGRLYVYTRNKLFVIDAEKNTPISVHNATRQGFSGMLATDNAVLVNQPGLGLQQVMASALKPVQGGEFFAQGIIHFAVKTNADNLLVGTEAGGQYSLINYNVQRKEAKRAATQATSIVQSRGLAHAAWLAPIKPATAMLAIATADRGCLLLDADGTLRAVLDTTTGLPSGNVHAMCAAPDGSLWLLHDRGLTHVAFTLPVTDLGALQGLSGTVLCVQSAGPYVYIGTTTGLFYLYRAAWMRGSGLAPADADFNVGLSTDQVEEVALNESIVAKLEDKPRLGKRAPGKPSAPQNFLAGPGQFGARRVKNVNGKCYQLLAYDGQLLAATDGGMVRIKHTDKEPVAQTVAFARYYVPRLLPGKPGSNRVYAIKGNAVVAAERKGDAWQELAPLQGYAGNVHDMAEGNGALYVTTTTGLWRLTKGKAQKVALPSALRNGTLSLKQMGGRVYVAGKQNVLAIDEQGGIKPAAAFRALAGARFFDAPGTEVWALKDNLLVRIRATPDRAKMDTSYTVVALPAQAQVLGSAGTGYAWAVAANKLYRIALKSVTTKPAPVNLTAIYNQGEKLQPAADELGYEDNKPVFQFSVAPHAGPALYQYQLLGADGRWTTPSAEASANFSNLSPGSYTFQVRGITAVGKTPVTTFAFEIATPWYATWWAIAGYVLIGGGLVYGFVRLRLWSLEQQRKKLVDEVGRKTGQLQEAKRDLEQKNYLLSETAQELQQKLDIIRQREQELAERNRSFEENNKLLTLSNRNLVDLTETVEEQNRELELQKRVLEAQKTELETANRQLEESNRAIQAAQEQLVKQERDAAIGRLVAQVAHEINSPIGAIKGTAQGMLTSLPEAMRQVPALLRDMPPPLTDLFLKLAAISLQNEENYSTREERKLRADYETLLVGLGLGDAATDLADRLVKLGPVQDLHVFLPMLGSTRAYELLDATLSLVKIGRSARKIRDAVESTQRIVVNLKLTAYQEQTDEPQEYDLADTIDRVLVLYNYNVKQGIEIVKDYAVVPICKGYPQELGQVWNNLVSNAIHAMGGVGSLHITIAPATAGWVQTSFTDNGPGIPPGNAAKIFDQFFTTKAKGEGTGLGLFICKKIVEKHRGTISVASEPGKTTFTILLPVDGPPWQPPTEETPTAAVPQATATNSSPAAPDGQDDILLSSTHQTA